MSRSAAALMLAGVLLGFAGATDGFGAFIIALFLGAVGFAVGWLLDRRAGAEPGTSWAEPTSSGRHSPADSGREQSSAGRLR